MTNISYFIKTPLVNLRKIISIKLESDEYFCQHFDTQKYFNYFHWDLPQSLSFTLRKF